MREQQIWAFDPLKVESQGIAGIRFDLAEPTKMKPNITPLVGV
jgi:hypothetical protein